jgi:hypothetical protein
MNLRDLLAQTVISIGGFPGDPGCEVILFDTTSLGCFQVEAGAWQQVLTMLIRGAVRASGRAGTRIEVAAEQFTDDLTNQDWVEISIPSPRPITALRQRHAEIMLRGVGGHLDLEALPGDGPCVYRIYMPSTPVLVPFPAKRGWSWR